MNFAKASNELKDGKRIRRKDWEPLMHLALVDGHIKTYRSEVSLLLLKPDILLSDGWMIRGDKCKKTFGFVEAIDYLRNKKHLVNTAEDWPVDTYIFLDGNKLANVAPVECDFIPSFECLCALDWEIMK